MRRISLPWTSPAEALLYICLCLIVFGMVNVFSASFVLAGRELNDNFYFIKRHLLYFVIGLVAFISMARFDYRKLRPLGPPLVLVSILLLIAVPLFGLEANGARRWLRILGIVFQPSELAKISTIFMAAGFLGPRLDRNLPNTLLSWPVLAAVGMGYLVLRQPDMGTAMVIMALCLVLYLIAGIPSREIVGLWLGGGVLFVYLVRTAAYRFERIMAWLNPWAYQQTSGYQAVQALLAIGSGGLTGTGLGMGASKFHYLPEAHTDFAYAVLAQEMGFLGALTVIVLFSLLGWYGTKISLQASDGFGQLLGMGIILLVVGQAIGNIAMVSGILPVTGVPLPFISYGGTSLIVNMFSVGILFSIGIRSMKPGSEAQEPPGTAIERVRERARLRLIRK